MVKEVFVCVLLAVVINCSKLGVYTNLSFCKLMLSVVLFQRMIHVSHVICDVTLCDL